MVRQTASTIILEILGGLILLVLVAAGLLVLRLASGPIDLGFMRDDVENALSASRDGRRVSIDSIQLEWSSQRRRVNIAARSIQLLDGKARISAQAQRADLVLSGSSLALGKVDVLRIDLQDGWINVDQIGPSQWSIAGDPLAPFEVVALPVTLEGWMAYADRLLPDLLITLRQQEDRLSLEQVSFQRVEIRLRDLDQRELFKITDATGDLTREPDGVRFGLDGKGVGAGLPGELGLDMQSSEQGQRMTAAFSIAEWPLGELAARVGLAESGFSGLAARVAIGTDFNAARGVERLTVDLQTGAGTLAIGPGGLRVGELVAAAEYSKSDDVLSLRVSNEGAGPFQGTATVRLSDVLSEEAFRDFEITSPSITLGLMPFLEAPVTISSITAKGAIDLKAVAVENLALSFATGDTPFDVRGDLRLTPGRQAGEPPVLAALAINVPGNLAKETVLALWPVKLGDGARRFGIERVEAATISNAKARVEIKRDSFAQGHLKDEHLEVTFAATGARVRFLDDLPAVENASGTGRLTGNTFKMIARSGSYGGWTIDEGLVDFPAFVPRGEKFRIFAKGRGPAANVIRTLSESRLALDLDAARFSGQSELTFEMFRPAADDVPYEQVSFTAKGTVRDGGMKATAFGVDFTDGVINVDVDQSRLVLTGDGKFGPAPASFSLRQDIGEDAANRPADLTASAIMSPDMLNRFGLLGRSYVTGEAPMQITGKLKGADMLSADLALDLTDARIDVSEIGWLKPKGAAATGNVRYAMNGDQSVSRIKLASANARLDGDITLGTDSRLVAATIREAFLKNSADVSGSAVRAGGESLRIQLKGRYLDISGLMPGLGAVGAGAAENQSSFSLEADVDRLTLRAGLDMRKAVVSMTSTTAGLQAFSARGITADGAALQATIDASGANPARIKVTSGNAGFLAAAFLGADFISGGELALDGTLERGNTPAQLQIQITNARFSNAPFLTQILSLASLRGLADTLSGEGVLFSRIDIPLKSIKGRFIVEGAKAQGPALGLTANGFIDGRTGSLEVDGVLVPSFGVNSALGGIPILGDLVVGRDGEGVFSLTYSVRGTLEKASVAVNPLSALAPGVIRRIFENPSDTKVPEAKPRPLDAPLPAELPAIKDETF